MVRLLALLGVAMFLTLLIGGQDRGQARLGLSQQPLLPPLPVRTAAATPKAAPTVEELVPVAAPVPATAPVVAEAAPAAEAPVAEAPTFTLSALAEQKLPEPQPTTVLYVAATSVNVRQGPSTGDAVLDRLERNEAVTLVADAGDGWVQIRIEGDGIEGFVASRLLTDKAPAP